jgi:subtilisin
MTAFKKREFKEAFMGNSIGRFPDPPRPQPTGRHLVLFHPAADLPAISGALERAMGVRAIDSREFGPSAAGMETVLDEGNMVVIDRFKVAAVAGPTVVGARMAALQGAEPVRQVRPEFYMFAIDDLPHRYAKWVREGLQLLADGATSAMQMARSAVSDVTGTVSFMDSDEATWGLSAVGAHGSPYTGRSIRIAVLDTGLDLEHPDFSGRAIVAQSFVEGEDVSDVQGHGTHCAGTIAGPKRSSLGRRYGVAPEAELYIGKVLNNNGSGTEFGILNGMNWAIDQNCVAISMSLGRATSPGERPDPLYEEVGKAALREGCLIIAAAGNESARDFNYIAPVGAPANSTSILAVAAVDPSLNVAPFSCGGINSDGGEINLSAPGTMVYSSYPRPRLTRVLQGTSMACPHVAGVAALWAESDPSLRGRRLWEALERSTRQVGLARDYGKGLVQAPGGTATA